MSKRGLAFLLFWVGIMLGRAIFFPQNFGEPCKIEPLVTGKIVRVRRLTGQSIQYELRTPEKCGVLVTLPRFPEYAAGTVLALDGPLATIADWKTRNEGYAQYLVRQDIQGTMQFATVQVVHAQDADKTIKSNLIEHTHAAFREPEGAALAAMMWGEPVRLPQAIEENFRRVGVTHILAISGFNLTLVAAGLWGVALLLPLPPSAAALFVTALVWGYVGLVGAPISAVRAAWFWTLVLCGLRIKWLISPLTVMLLTAAAMMTIDPQVIFDVGFQLSIAAVAGIWLAWFVSRPHFAAASRGRPWLPKWLITLVVSTIGATLATAPLVAYHFGVVSLTTVAANIFIVPATVAFNYAGFIGLLAHYVFPPLALLVSFGVHVIWQFMDFVTSWLAGLPGLTLTEVAVPWITLPVYYGVIAGLCIFWLRRQRRSWREVWA